MTNENSFNTLGLCPIWQLQQLLKELPRQQPPRTTMTDQEPTEIGRGSRTEVRLVPHVSFLHQQSPNAISRSEDVGSAVWALDVASREEEVRGRRVGVWRRAKVCRACSSAERPPPSYFLPLTRSSLALVSRVPEGRVPRQPSPLGPRLRVQPQLLRSQGGSSRAGDAGSRG